MNLSFLSDESGDPAGAAPEHEGAVGIAGYLLRLSNQTDHIQAQLTGLSAEVRMGSDQLTALTRHLAGPAGTTRLEDRLAELAAGLAGTQDRLDQLRRQNDEANGAVAKLARTQYKSNTLVENKDQLVAAAVAALQEVIARREELVRAGIDQEPVRLAGLRSEGRRELVVELLPGLDGLELALDSGRDLLARQRRRLAQAEAAATLAEPTPRPPEGAVARLRRALLGEPDRTMPNLSPSPPPPPEPVDISELLAALEGWLNGLQLVRERYLALLALESVEPIMAQGQPFDPRLHAAVAAEEAADIAPGTVLKMLRTGYRMDGRVLRYAEVVVSRAPSADRAAAFPAHEE